MNKPEMITKLQESRAVSESLMSSLTDTAKRFNRKMSVNEIRAFNAAEKAVLDIDDRINELRGQVEAANAAAPMNRKYAPAAGTGVTRNESVYRPDGQSFFADLYAARRHGDPDAQARLHANTRQVNDVKLREGRAIDTSTGSAGAFVPPLWLEDQFMAFARPGRTAADLTFKQNMPPSTDTLTIPRITTGTKTGIQSGGQNNAIVQQDMVTDTVASPVVTLAGGQVMSLQLLEQSPVNFDHVVLADLAADYASFWDSQVLSGTGANGQVQGILTLSGISSVAWTQSTPSLLGASGLYGALANAIQKIYSARHLPATAILMHPRRWSWLSAQGDSSGRPVVLGNDYNPVNAAGIAGAPVAEGQVGMLLGLPVYTDPNLPVNGGAGLNQDSIIVARWSDLMTWESPLKAEVFDAPYAASMGVFTRVYAYGASIPGRSPAGIAVITGTGAVDPWA